MARADMKLEVGQVNEIASVEATQEELQTEKSDSHSKIVAKQIQNMPLSGYRNYQTLVNLVPAHHAGTVQGLDYGHALTPEVSIPLHTRTNRFRLRDTFCEAGLLECQCALKYLENRARVR